MSKSIKFKDEAYVDSSGTVFNQKPLSEIFGNILLALQTSQV